MVIVFYNEAEDNQKVIRQFGHDDVLVSEYQAC